MFFGASYHYVRYHKAEEWPYLENQVWAITANGLCYFRLQIIEKHCLMSNKYKFNRFEFSGSMGDLGTLLPIIMGMALVNKLNPAGMLFSVGLLYVFTGWYYGIPTSVQPMKVIASYAIAMSITPHQIQASCILMCSLLLLIGLTGSIDTIEKCVPRSVVRGVQMTTGIILMIKGVNFILGNSNIQLMKEVAEPYLSVQHIGFLPIGIVIGIMSFSIILFLHDNQRVPAGIIVVGLGACIGLLFGIKETVTSIETEAPFFCVDFPRGPDFGFALVNLVIPQIPMTIGNAVIANKDLSITYFSQNTSKVTNRAICSTMAFGNLISVFFGGMPICHGAGGLAAHYRFGARSAGSNMIIGIAFILFALLLKEGILGLVSLIPLSTLGILLAFSGVQLVLTILDVKKKEDMFVIFTILAITFASNLGWGFLVGIIIARILKLDRAKI